MGASLVPPPPDQPSATTTTAAWLRHAPGRDKGSEAGKVHTSGRRQPGFQRTPPPPRPAAEGGWARASPRLPQHV